MRDLAMRALDTAKQQGAAYADARVVRLKSQSVEVRNHNVEALSSDESQGLRRSRGVMTQASARLANSAQG